TAPRELPLYAFREICEIMAASYASHREDAAAVDGWCSVALSGRRQAKTSGTAAGRALGRRARLNDGRDAMGPGRGRFEGGRRTEHVGVPPPATDDLESNGESCSRETARD